MRFLESTPDAAAVGPKLLNSDGSLQASCRSFPNLLNMAVFSFGNYSWLPRRHRPLRYLMECWDHSGLLAVDYVVGAVLMIKRAVLESVGVFDEKYFLYGEEKEWCYRAHQAGYGVYYCPDAQVIHVGGQSSRQVSGYALSQLYASHERFLRRHYGPCRAVLLTGILRLGLAFRAIGCGLLGLLYYQKRASMWQRAAVYGRVLRMQCRGNYEGA
jgi:GT2 family glycosyltransferase